MTKTSFKEISKKLRDKLLSTEEYSLDKKLPKLSKKEFLRLAREVKKTFSDEDLQLFRNSQVT